MPEIVQSAPDLVLLQRRIAATADAVAGLVAAAPRADVPVPGLDWDVGQVVQHLTVQAERYSDFVQGRRSPEQDLVGHAGTGRDLVAAVNQALVDGAPLLPPAELAARLRGAVQGYADVLATATADAPFRSWEGASDVGTGAATFLGELLVHGDDVARALRAPWRVDPDDSRAALHAVLVLLPHYVDEDRTAEVDARLRLRVRGGPDLLLVVRRGTATVLPAAGRSDATIVVDPAALLLLAYRRRTLPAAVLRGEVVAWGRRPRVALDLLRWFTPP